MKYHLLILFVVIIVLFGVFGCSAFAPPTNPTPQDLALKQVTDAETLYIIATTPIDLAIANGDIKGGEAKALQASEIIAWNHIMAAHDAVKAGRTVDADTQLQLFKSARDELVKAFAKAKTPPATQPN